MQLEISEVPQGSALEVDEDYCRPLVCHQPDRRRFELRVEVALERPLRERRPRGGAGTEVPVDRGFRQGSDLVVDANVAILNDVAPCCGLRDQLALVGFIARPLRVVVLCGHLDLFEGADLLPA